MLKIGELVYVKKLRHARTTELKNVKDDRRKGESREAG